jgi:hypothetical protein
MLSDFSRFKQFQELTGRRRLPSAATLQSIEWAADFESGNVCDCQPKRLELQFDSQPRYDRHPDACGHRALDGLGTAKQDDGPNRQTVVGQYPLNEGLGTGPGFANDERLLAELLGRHPAFARERVAGWDNWDQLIHTESRRFQF